VLKKEERHKKAPKEVTALRKSELGARKELILRTVIEEYVKSAAPVGSQLIADKYSLSLSPATIRHVMAELEELGYLYHPHTSAGRVPSDKGYRYFVEYLMGDPVLPWVEQLTIRHQFFQVQMDVEQWMHLAASIMAQLTHAAGLVTAPKASKTKLKRVELIPVQDQLVLIILILQEGTVKRQLVSFPESVDDDILRRLAGLINGKFEGLTAAQMERRLAKLEGAERMLGEYLVKMMRVWEKQALEEIYFDGFLNILEFPEFSQSRMISRIFEFLRGGTFMTSLLPRITADQSVKILIGSENMSEDLRSCSMVLVPYGIPGEATGLLGVIGPTRMAYSRTIPTVKYVGSLMTELVGEICD